MNIEAKLLAVVCALALLFVAARGRADADADARGLFERAVSLADAGQIDAAIEAFEQAYATRPHPAVLFNLGQAYSAGGRPLDAVRTLRAYLASGAASESRRGEVERLIGFNQARIGKLSVRVVPDSADVSIDGKSLGIARELSVIELSAGAHVVTASAGGYTASTRNVAIRPWQEGETSLALTLDAQPVAQAEPARLELQVEPKGARVSVDGERYDAKKALAGGPHWVSVEHPGYETWQARVELAAGSARTVRATLHPITSDVRPVLARRMRIAALTTAALAVAAGGTALGLHLASNHAYNKYGKDFAPTPRAVQVQRLDDAAISCTVLAGLSLATSATLWFMRPRLPVEVSVAARGRGLALSTRW